MGRTAVAFVLCFAFALGGVAGAASDDFKFGIVAYHNPLESYKLNAEDFVRMAENGIGWISVDFAWRDIEQERGSYDFSYYDFVVEEAQRNGLQIVAKVGNGYNGNRPVVPDWTNELGEDEYNVALSAYAEAVAGRYRDVLEYYALENEANVAENHVQNGWRVGDWSEAKVARILKTLEQSIRAKDPEAKLVLSVSTCNAGDWVGWIERRAGEIGFDVIGPQAYPCIISSNPDKAYDIANDVDSVRSFGREVMFLETGYHTYFRSESNQAQYVENACRAAKEAGASGIFFYEYLENSEEPSGSERRFGLLHEDREPKPAWERYGSVISELSA